MNSRERDIKQGINRTRGIEKPARLSSARDERDHLPLVTDSTYYYCNGDTSTHTSQQGGGCSSGGPESSADVASRSPLAATRASSGASAASPTGSACTKPDHTSTPTDLYLA